MNRTHNDKNLLANEDESDLFSRVDVAVEVFLNTSFEERTDYVDGRLVLAGVGDRLHGTTVGYLIEWLSKSKLSGWTFSGLHLNITPTRYRSVDVCAYLSRPEGDYPATPPFVCIDVLSPDDHFQDFWGKQEDLVRMGVPNVWIVDPYQRKLFEFDGKSMTSVSELVTQDPDAVLTEAELLTWCRELG